ncbi:MAG: hypothetical protein ACK5B9_03625 [Flavobacteriia bacterium]|jgi:hypothetical protein
MSILNDLSDKWTNLTTKFEGIKDVLTGESTVNDEVVETGTEIVQNTINPITSQINWGTGGLDNKTMLYGVGILAIIYFLFKK